ncbi:restriction endonuclease subunit S [Ruminococcus sp.]|uniref:restriction endonuclease subunit S n=1 Tax=Ruminococcus sp. TaxID=41978 RepID=UPI003FD70BDA
MIQYLKLGSLTRIRTGKLDANAADDNGKYPFFTCSKEPLSINTCSYDCECVLVAGNGDLNVKYYDGKFDAYQRTYIIESLDKTKLMVKYLYCFLDLYVEILRQQAIGGVIKYIKLGNLADAIIPVPVIEKQREIIEIFEKCNGTIAYRHQELLLMDQLVKSRFIEMFGDPKRNPRKWDMVTIGDIATDVRYGTSRPATEGGKYPYLRMNNLTYEGYLDLTDLKHIDIPDNEVEKCVVRNGDVLFNRTNSVELVGKTCVYNLDSDMIIAGYIIRVRIDDRVLPVILSSYLNSTVMKEQLRSMAKGAVNQANINAQELRSIPIYLPPITLQHEFATFVEQVDKSKFEIQQSLEKLEILKKSLMQQYFG